MGEKRYVQNAQGKDITSISLAVTHSFRKKPVVIQAVQMSEEFYVETLEGTMKGNPGDWLIQGIKGELYPCKDEIFIETYEETPNE